MKGRVVAVEQAPEKAKQLPALSGDLGRKSN
jgi:hypothetical protein